MGEVAKETLQGISVMACVNNVELFNACVMLYFYSFQALLHSFESTTAPFLLLTLVSINVFTHFR